MINTFKVKYELFSLGTQTQASTIKQIFHIRWIPLWCIFHSTTSISFNCKIKVFPFLFWFLCGESFGSLQGILSLCGMQQCHLQNPLSPFAWISLRFLQPKQPQRQQPRFSCTNVYFGFGIVNVLIPVLHQTQELYYWLFLEYYPSARAQMTNSLVASSLQAAFFGDFSMLQTLPFGRNDRSSKHLVQNVSRGARAFQLQRPIVARTNVGQRGKMSSQVPAMGQIFPAMFWLLCQRKLRFLHCTSPNAKVYGCWLFTLILNVYSAATPAETGSTYKRNGPKAASSYFHPGPFVCSQ